MPTNRFSRTRRALRWMHLPQPSAMLRAKDLIDRWICETTLRSAMTWAIEGNGVCQAHAREVSFVMCCLSTNRLWRAMERSYHSSLFLWLFSVGRRRLCQISENFGEEGNPPLRLTSNGWFKSAGILGRVWRKTAQPAQEDKNRTFIFVRQLRLTFSLFSRILYLSLYPERCCPRGSSAPSRSCPSRWLSAASQRRRQTLNSDSCFRDPSSHPEENR